VIGVYRLAGPTAALDAWLDLREGLTLEPTENAEGP
jgi:hypothetical protein